MNGEDPGWSWSNLNCEPGVEIENWALDTRPEGNERCVCTLADPAYGRDVNQVQSLTGAISLAKLTVALLTNPTHSCYLMPF